VRRSVFSWALWNAASSSVDRLGEGGIGHKSGLGLEQAKAEIGGGGVPDRGLGEAVGELFGGAAARLGEPMGTEGIGQCLQLVEADLESGLVAGAHGQGRAHSCLEALLEHIPLLGDLELEGLHSLGDEAVPVDHVHRSPAP
jgi:hypothetical protein